MIIKTQKSTSFSAIRFVLGTAQKEIDAAKPHQIRDWLTIIERKLRVERSRGLTKHYRYDLNRHIALASAHRFLATKLK